MKLNSILLSVNFFIIVFSIAIIVLFSTPLLTINEELKFEGKNNYLKIKIPSNIEQKYLFANYDEQGKKIILNLDSLKGNKLRQENHFITLDRNKYFKYKEVKNIKITYKKRILDYLYQKKER